jgi:hypothetical protein
MTDKLSDIVIRAGLRDAIRYHRKYHRPELFAPRPGSIRDCQLPSCRAFMAALEKSLGRPVR